jgi:hypothetical protein
MTEQERLRQSVARLMEAQQEALEVCGEALGPRQEEFEEEEAQAVREEVRMRAALEDVMDILVGASEDVRGVILEERDE